MSNTSPQVPTSMEDAQVEAASLESRLESNMASLRALICVARSDDFPTYSADIQNSYMGACEYMADAVLNDFRQVTVLAQKQEVEV